MRQLATLAILALALPAQAFAAVTVPIDQSRRVTFAGQAANVVVGNPAIADVSIVDTRTLLVMGKKFGVTNLVVLDANGRTLFDNEVVVSAGEGSVVSVYRGANASEYACSPYCQNVPNSSGGNNFSRSSSLAAQDIMIPVQVAPTAPAAPAASTLRPR